MPRYVATLRSAWTAERAFAYMADFSNAAEWDPSVAGATREDAGPVAEGSAFLLQIRSGRRIMRFRYEIVRMGLREVVLRAQTPLFESLDTISVQDAGAGSSVRYEASLRARGVLRLANPLVDRTLRRMGDAARDRLSKVLAG